jgi:hypothetical protein
VLQQLTSSSSGCPTTLLGVQRAAVVWAAAAMMYLSLDLVAPARLHSGCSWHARARAIRLGCAARLHHWAAQNHARVLSCRGGWSCVHPTGSRGWCWCCCCCCCCCPCTPAALAMHPPGLRWQRLAAVAAAQGCAGRCVFHGALQRLLHAPTAGHVLRGVGGCGPGVWAQAEGAGVVCLPRRWLFHSTPLPDELISKSGC